MESLLEYLHSYSSSNQPTPESKSRSTTNMEKDTALPERLGASDTASDSLGAQTEPDNSKPNSKAPAENSRTPKAKKEKAPKTPKPPKGPAPSKVKKESAAKPSVEDPESMFKVGFLSDVYQERPVGPDGISKVITRCKLSVQEFTSEFHDLRADQSPPSQFPQSPMASSTSVIAKRLQSTSASQSTMVESATYDWTIQIRLAKRKNMMTRLKIL